MLYGTIRTTRVREGKDWRTTETLVEYEPVDSEAEALTHFISFVRDANAKGYIEPVFKPVFKKGKLYRVIKEYTVIVDG